MLETAVGLYVVQPCDYRLRSGSGLVDWGAGIEES